ncbi:MAG: hypothetical protein WBB52_02265 [Acidimicrobiales bacterium]
MPNNNYRTAIGERNSEWIHCAFGDLNKIVPFRELITATRLTARLNLLLIATRYGPHNQNARSDNPVHGSDDHFLSPFSAKTTGTEHDIRRWPAQAGSSSLGTYPLFGSEGEVIGG